jgi:hypothetical protein
MYDLCQRERELFIIIVPAGMKCMREKSISVVGGLKENGKLGQFSETPETKNQFSLNP